MEIKNTRPDMLGRWLDWFGVWAIYEPAAQLLVQQIQGFDLRAHVAAEMSLQRSIFEDEPQVAYDLQDGIATIPVQGMISKAASSLGGASTVSLRRSIRAAQADAKVQGILLAIDSPGGTVAGTPDAADEIFASRGKKPIWTHFEDLGASGAYYLGSQAERVVGNSSALVGSIGVYTVVRDTSKMMDEIGVKVHVVRAGDFKGLGTPGTEVTDAQLAELQRTINEQYAMFVKAVMRGMNMTKAQVEALADGAVHVGENALAKGLIHSVASLDQTAIDFRQYLGKSKPTGKGAAMTTETPTTPKPATLVELRNLCAGASDTFLLAQLEAQATSEQALKAFCAKLHAESQAVAKERDEALAKVKTLESEIAAIPQKPAAVKPLASGAKPSDGGGVSAREQWDAAIADLVTKGMSRPKATEQVALKQPELRVAMLAEVQASRA